MNFHFLATLRGAEIPLIISKLDSFLRWSKASKRFYTLTKMQQQKTKHWDFDKIEIDIQIRSKYWTFFHRQT